MVDKKEVTKKVESNESRHQILYYISQYLTISEIAKLRKTSRTAVYKIINKLIELNQLRKIGTGYEITENGLHYLNKYSSGLIRLHNLAFKVLILNRPINWELKRSKVVESRVLSKQVDLNNNSYEIHNFSNLKIKTSNNSVIFYMPHIYGKTTDECFQTALDYLFKSIPKIENLFKIVLIKDRKANIEIISSHYAKLQDSLAKIYKTENNKLYVKDELGTVWLIADYSFKVNELETINANTAKEDMDSVQSFLNDLRRNPATFTNVLELVKSVAANQVIFDKNMSSHIEAIQTLSKEVKRLSRVFKSTIKENRKYKLGTQKTLWDF